MLSCGIHSLVQRRLTRKSKVGVPEAKFINLDITHQITPTSYYVWRGTASTVS